MEFQLCDKECNYEDICYNSIIISLLIIYSTAISVIMFIKQPKKVIKEVPVKIIKKVPMECIKENNDEEELLIAEKEKLLFAEKEKLLFTNKKKILFTEFVEFTKEEERILAESNLTNCSYEDIVFTCKSEYERKVVNALSNWRDAYEKWWNDLSKYDYNGHNHMFTKVKESLESDKYIDNINSINLFINPLLIEETTSQLANKEKHTRIELLKAIEKDYLYNKFRYDSKPTYLTHIDNEMLSNILKIKKEIQTLINTY